MVDATQLKRRTQTTAGVVLAIASLLGSLAVGASINEPSAYAAAPGLQEYQQKLSDQAQLKAQLVGVNQDLADQILALNDLVENQIPAAQQAADEAAESAQQAQAVADATNARLKAAQKDKADLEARIEQTGEDYDDATQAVASLARSSFHGSDASDVMEVVTNATTTEDFVDQMQAQSAVTRTEATAADQAANTLSTSENRKQRLDAIEQEIATLKSKADSDAAAAKQAAEEADAKKSDLDAKRDESAAARESLEQRKSSLTTQSAKEAADIVTLKSQIDSYNRQYENSIVSNPSTGGAQQVGGGGGSSGSSGGGSSGGSSGGGGGSSGGGGSASGMNYSVPGSCPPNSTYCYGHSTGNVAGVWGTAYPWDQCTRYAYNRRQELNLPVGSYLGNGQDWGNSARRLGYLVNNTPHYGAVISFKGGQLGHSALYGHVGVVERLNSDGTILISESGSVWGGHAHWATIYNPGLYTYVHY